MSRSRQTLAVLALGAAAAVLVFLLVSSPEEGTTFDADAGLRTDATETPPGMLRTDPRGPTTATDGESAVEGSAAQGARGTLRGRVLDERARPIQDAAVQVAAVDPALLRGAPYPDGPVLAGTRSDREGRFALEAPADTWLRVTASAPDYATVGRLVASTGASIELRLPAAGTLVVAVRDEADRPVAEADVAVQIDQTSVRARSDAEGLAALDALPPGNARVQVAREGYAAVRAGPYPVQAGVAVRATVVLPTSIGVEGVVLAEADASPVAGARVFVARPGRAAAAAPTGPDGRFGPVPGGGAGERVFVSVHAPGFAPTLEPVVLHGPRSQSVAIRLVAAEDWTGRVLRPDGQPAAGARVAYTADGVAGRTPDAAQADADGRFALPPPPPPTPGRRVLLVARLGGLEAALALRPGMVRPDPLELRLAGGATVTGRIVGADQAPRAGVQVRLAPAWRAIADRSKPSPSTARLLLANESGFAGLSAATGADGTWHIAAVPPGPYTVRVRRDGAEVARPEVLAVGEGAVSAGTWTLDVGAVLRGRILDARGRPVAGAAVRVAATDGSAVSRRTTTDGDGRYAFGALAPSLYRLSATLGARSPTTVQVRLDGDREGVDLQLEEEAVLEGRVVLRDGGRPYAGLLTLGLHTAADRARTTHSLRVVDGAFRWEAVPPGTWSVEGRAPGALVGHSGEAIEVESGRASRVTLTLAPRAVLAGRVRQASGKAVNAARLTLTSEDDGGRRLATADAAGHFRFEGLAPGAYVLEAWGRGGAPVEERVHVGAGATRPLDVTLADAGRARVTVVDEQDRPVAGAVVLFRTDAGMVPALRPDRTARDGMVTRADLPVGPVEIRARTTDGRRGFAQIVIDADHETATRVRVLPVAR